MTTLIGICVVVLTIAIIFGRRVAARLVIIGLICCVVLVGGLVGYYYYNEHVQAVREEHVAFAMSHLPSGISDADKVIFKNEFDSYFGGTYDNQHVPDLDVIDQYLENVDPSLVRRR